MGAPDVVTARNIAKQCGILSKGGIVMEGSEFRRLTLEQARPSLSLSLRLALRLSLPTRTMHVDRVVLIITAACI
jgi:hypothetical protein